MNQRLSDWANIAEIISGVAVVITLVFLILGIRENTEVTRASMYDSNIDSLIQIRDRMIADPDVAELWVTYRRGEFASLSEADRVRIEMLIYNVFNAHEKAYFARQYGVLGESEWGRFADQICLQYDRIVQGGEDRIRFEVVVTEEFADYVKNLCSGDSRQIE